MSADRQRLVSAIRRIAKTDPEISSALSSPGMRGDQPAASGVGVSSGADNRQCCDGSEVAEGGGNANPGTEQTDSSQGGQSGGLDGGNPARLAGDNGEPVSALEGLADCATGHPVAVQLAGGGWVPPDGWENPTEPPLDDSHAPGYYWVSNDQYAPSVYGPTISAVHESLPSTFTHYTYGYSYSKGGLYDVQGTSARVNYIGNDEDPSAFIAMTREECPGSPAGAIAEACDPSNDDLYQKKWPYDGQANLAIKNGAIVGSKYDPANDGSYNLPRNGIELCDAHGNSILLEATESGGWRSIKSLGGEPDPDTVGYEYNGRGEIVRVMSTGEWKATGRDPRNF